MGGSTLLLVLASVPFPPIWLLKGSGGDSMSPIGYTGPAGTSNGSRNVASGSNQIMNISRNQVPRDFQRRIKPLFSRSNDARVEPSEHLLPTSFIVKMSKFCYIYYCSSFRFNLSYMTLHLESLALPII